MFVRFIYHTELNSATSGFSCVRCFNTVLIFVLVVFSASAHTVETTIDEYPGVSGITTARDAMRNLSEEDKDKIAAQVCYVVKKLFQLCTYFWCCLSAEHCSPTYFLCIPESNI